MEDRGQIGGIGVIGVMLVPNPGTYFPLGYARRPGKVGFGGQCDATRLTVEVGAEILAREMERCSASERSTPKAAATASLKTVASAPVSSSPSRSCGVGGLGSSIVAPNSPSKIRSSRALRVWRAVQAQAAASETQCFHTVGAHRSWLSRFGAR